ncbi:prepilin peptidase [Halioglobus japonicus]|uniref:Prepilin leader peptidase/N-methyltransferase n=1 Tax=Halioglobus japonicus TaxID=930805 RepID=A0AAP8MG27_9GAMM|nr:A24 family peptidase [Halioglobus japonicus]AQA19765.1 prepilin peptidase [Halioglobus japonicus]PLW87163.1 prepilin peptidase [Halioglobus japonicus]GHD09897.1 type 4 prepilin-like proteins leader peptide-processing enzyme [Halioglobus japonicus]
MSEILALHPGLTYTVLLALGLIVGSFLNVVIHRLPIMMESRWRRDCCELLEVEPEKEEPQLTLATPNSHCPACQAPIKPWQNIPVLSYLLLGGSCANCGVRISVRYPIIELLTGLMTLALAWFFPPSPALLGAMLLTWALIALTMIDIDHQLLPDDITLPLMWLGLLFNLCGTFVPIEQAVIGAMGGYLSLWSVYWIFKLLTGKEGMGYGDFKLLAALGAWLGWQMLPLIILLSSVVGAVVGIGLMIARNRGREVPIPFGPYLAAAGWLALIVGDTLNSTLLGVAPQ